MAWPILILSGMVEAVWASALSRMADGFRWNYLMLFIVGCTLSVGGLMWSMRDIHMGTAYAAWASTGAVTTVAWAIFSGAESASLLKIALVAGIVICIMGLHLIEGGH